MASHRYYFAHQHHWEQKRGFYLSFENSTEQPVCRLDTLKLILGVGDGQGWHFLSTFVEWRVGVRYRVRAEIHSDRSRLQVGGNFAEERFEGFIPAEGNLVIGEVPHWASGDTDYHLAPCTLVLTSGGNTLRYAIGGPRSRLHEPLLHFNPQLFWGIGGAWQTAVTPFSVELPLTIECTLELRRIPDWRKYAPYIDRYGQCRYAQFARKVRSDADLKREWEREKQTLREWGVPREYDQYGGYLQAGWRSEATGFYRVEKRDDFWWLVTPEGNPCFYMGVCSAPMDVWEMTPVSGREEVFEWLPPQRGEYTAVWATDVWGEGQDTRYVSLHAVNLMRRLGKEWRDVTARLARQRLRTWAFAGVGKWGYVPGLPFFPVLNRSGVPNLAEHPDIFDPGVQRQFEQHLRRQMQPHLRSPWVVGWSVGNEESEIIRRREVRHILQRADAPPAKRALIEHALKTIYEGNLRRLTEAWNIAAADFESLCRSSITAPTEADVETLRQFYMDRYHEWLYRTVKRIAPHHLYCGSWIYPYVWEGEQDWFLMEKHCDILGYDYYHLFFAPELLTRLLDRTKKPVLCGEFTFATWEEGQRGYGAFMGCSARDEQEAGEWYARWVRDAAQHPLCVGGLWFQYRDQPLTGRGPGRGKRLFIGEHAPIGIVEFTDRPKWDLVKRMREVNRQSVWWRLQQTRMRR
ncbi:MAG: glycosyl hydrolase [Armatimonadota bacterium]|nr:glycosyl hydrolase [Armatimonadota bacterium]